MNWTTWPLNLWSKEQTFLDTKKVYLKVEFLTQEEKIKKDIVLAPLLEQAQNDPGTLIPFEEHYRCSYRFTFKAPEKNPPTLEQTKISIKELMGQIILSSDEETKSFYETYIDGIKLIMQNNESLGNDFLVDLYNETEINCYEPGEILEIIYYEKSLWERVKNKGKSVVKKIPSLMMSLVERLVGFVLMLLGLNGGMSAIVWRMVPSKKILEWLVMLISMFFPAMGPLLGIGKMLL